MNSATELLEFVNRLPISNVQKKEFVKEYIKNIKLEKENMKKSRKCYVNVMSELLLTS
jgi:HD superfamily phosphodiesterase